MVGGSRVHSTEMIPGAARPPISAHYGLAGPVRACRALMRHLRPSPAVFGFIALPDAHIFLKPNVTRAAAREYGFDFRYQSRPNWEMYVSLLAFAEAVRRDQRDLRPRHDRPPVVHLGPGL